MSFDASSSGHPRLTVRTTTSGSLEIVALSVGPSRGTVQVQGEVDLVTADLLATALDDELGQGHRFVRLDLSRLSFIDCAGLRVLVSAHNRFLAAQGTLVLTGVGQLPARLLRITHLDRALLVADGAGEPRRVRHLTSLPRRDDDG